MAANVGFVRRSQHEGHIDTIMPFFEYGKSHYASYLDTGARGDGRQHYTGGGILLRRDLDSGLYYEGAVRAGYLKGDFHGMIAKSMSRYDSGAPYILPRQALARSTPETVTAMTFTVNSSTPTSEATAPSSTAATATRSTISTPSIPMSPDSA